MANHRKTTFDRYREQKMASPEFAQAYQQARAEIDLIDQLIRELDSVRTDISLSKAELARKIGATPEIIRRLFTASSPNPTISTVVKIALALGMKLALVPAPNPVTEKSRRRGPKDTGRQGAILRGRRRKNSLPSLATAT
jgi:DNA-binding phage protein